jgi:hypothetical protein
MVPVILLLLGLVGCTSSPGSAPTTPGGSAPLPPIASLPSTPAQLPGDDDEPAPTGLPFGQASTAVAGFAAAWVRADLPTDRWWSGVAPFCEAGFARQLNTVDPANLPATKVTGNPVQISTPGEGVAVYTVQTDGGVLMVTVAAVNGRWLVTNNDFQRAVR